MEYLTSGRQILSHFFPHISSQRDIQNLWNCCPNQMLWEAISASDANVELNVELAEKDGREIKPGKKMSTQLQKAETYWS